MLDRIRYNPLSGEAFTAKAVGHTGRVLGTVTSPSIGGAMQGFTKMEHRLKLEEYQ